MTLFDRLFRKIRGNKYSKEDVDPAQAYDLWAQSYDAQPDNLMLKLEGELFTRLLQDEILIGKKIVDVGCGTGRHWEEMKKQNPAEIIGYDVSEGMLAQLNNKYPDAPTHVLRGNRLTGMEDNSCDIIVSTMTMAHIENIEEALIEWHRVLNSNGELIITDYHPAALARNGDRTFVHNHKLIAIKNYVHPVGMVLNIMLTLGFQVLYWDEQVIDDSVKHFYEKKNALHVFEQFRDVPIVYGAHLKKKNVTL